MYKFKKNNSFYVFCSNRWYSSEFWSFSIESESQNYQLHVSGYSGDAGDAFNGASVTNWITNGMQFGTPDRDNDRFVNGSCSKQSGWWYNICSTSTLNANDYGKWETLQLNGLAANRSVSASRMMMRRN